MSSRISQTAFFAFCMYLLSSAVVACTCTDYGIPPCKMFGDADAVFIGKIQRIVPASDDKDTSVSLGNVGSISHRGAGLLSVQFKIEKAFKGTSGTTARALTYTGTSCDLGVQEGQTWLIFANKDGKTGLLGFGACGGNQVIANDDDVVNELQEISNPAAAPIIRGRLTLGQFDGLKGVNITLTGKNTNLKTESNADGSFVFQAPKAGIYSVKVSIPFSAGLLFSSPNFPPQFKAENPTDAASKFSYDAITKLGACDYQYFDVYKIDLKATSSISGRFVQTNWKNFREFYPDLCRLKATEKETLESCSSLDGQLRPDGSFTFEGLREGRYTIAVGGDFPNGPEPFFRHYYPGVRDFSKAQVIEIRQGEQKKGIRFNLPSILPTRRVYGQIFASDGKPASLRNDDGKYFYLSAYFYLQEKDPQLFFQHSYRDEWKVGDQSREVEMINSNPDGRFDLELFDGFTYVLKVESGQIFNQYNCGIVTIDVNAKLKDPVRVVLDRERPCDVPKLVGK